VNSGKIMVDFWRCLRGGNGLILFLLVSGHEGSSHVVEADLQLKGTPVGVSLKTTTKLLESPATIEIEIDTTGLEPGEYDVVLSFDGEKVGTFPCEVRNSETVGA
jgi:hypothetical protein